MGSSVADVIRCGGGLWFSNSSRRNGEPYVVCLVYDVHGRLFKAVVSVSESTRGADYITAASRSVVDCGGSLGKCTVIGIVG